MTANPGLENLALQLDTRLGGVPRYVLAPKWCLVQIPPTIQKGVVFLACKRKGEEPEVRGTGFLVEYPFPEMPERCLRYLVTASHVIEGIKKRSRDPSVYVRLNVGVTDTAVYVEIPHTSWICNEDARIDVAITPFIHHDALDHLYVPARMFVTDDIIDKQGIGPGDDLYFPGLFSRHAGTKKNVPIVRVGNIASMPDERIETKRGNIHAYLVEARSIGGLSGSPVFVQIGTSRVVQGTLTFSVGEHGGYGSIFLLGMINGHFGETDPNAILYGEAKSVNMGIGIVVPAKDILSTFEHPALLAYRNAELRKPQEEKKQTLPEDD